MREANVSIAGATDEAAPRFGRRQSGVLVLGSRPIGHALLLSRVASPTFEWSVVHRADHPPACVAIEPLDQELAARGSLLLVVARDAEEQSSLLRSLPVAVGEAPDGRGRCDRSTTVEELHVDRDAHSARVAGQTVVLSKLEFKLLVFLLERRNQVQERATLLREVWGVAGGRQSRAVDASMKRLRDKLGRAGRLLRTVRGVGYRLDDTGHANGE